MNQFDDDTPPSPPRKRGGEEAADFHSTSSKPWGEDGTDSTTPPIPWEAMLCYLPVFCLYPWSLREEMPEIKEHARQGMILFAVELALFLITVPVFYKIVWIAILVIAVLGVLAAYNGRAYKLPVLWNLAEKVGVVDPVSTPVEDLEDETETAGK